MRATSTFLLKIATGVLLLVPPLFILHEASSDIYAFFKFRSLSLEELQQLPVGDPREISWFICLTIMKMWMPVVPYLLGIFLFFKLRKAKGFDEHELHLLQVATFFMATLIILWIMILLLSCSGVEVLRPMDDWESTFEISRALLYSRYA